MPLFGNTTIEVMFLIRFFKLKKYSKAIRLCVLNESILKYVSEDRHDIFIILLFGRVLRTKTRGTNSSTNIYALYGRLHFKTRRKTYFKSYNNNIKRLVRITLNFCDKSEIHEPDRPLLRRERTKISRCRKLEIYHSNSKWSMGAVKNMSAFHVKNIKGVRSLGNSCLFRERVLFGS